MTHLSCFISPNTFWVGEFWKLDDFWNISLAMCLIKALESHFWNIFLALSFSKALESFKLLSLKNIPGAWKFSKCIYESDMVKNISILFQKESIGHHGHFKFLKIQHHHVLEKSFSKPFKETIEKTFTFSQY